MGGTSSARIDKSGLTKGQLRKLRALRNSVGDEIGEKAFAEWRASQDGAKRKVDGNAATIVDTLWPLVEQGTLAIPRGGYLIRRGRSRIIVEPARSYIASRGVRRARQSRCSLPVTMICFFLDAGEPNCGCISTPPPDLRTN